MSAKVSVETYGDIPVPSKEDVQKIIDAIEPIALDSVRQNFGFGGRPERWRPLKKGGASYLFESGTLLQSIHSRQTVEEGFGAVDVESGDLPYAVIHQEGGYAGRNHSAYIPARPYMVFAEEDEQKMREKAIGMFITVLNTKQVDPKGKSVNRSEEF